ncbi:hypothetical protein ACYZTL_11705 [Pseudomonas sp. LB3P81]
MDLYIKSTKKLLIGFSENIPSAPNPQKAKIIAMCHLGTSQGIHLKREVSDQDRAIDQLKRTVEDLSRKVK